MKPKTATQKLFDRYFELESTRTPGNYEQLVDSHIALQKYVKAVVGKLIEIQDISVIKEG